MTTKDKALKATVHETIVSREQVINTINKIYDDFDSKVCENCKHFEVDEIIDLNKHFGYCTLEGSIAVDKIITINDGCTKFERKKDA